VDGDTSKHVFRTCLDYLISHYDIDEELKKSLTSELAVAPVVMLTKTAA